MVGAVPRDLQELALRVDQVVGDLTRDLGRQPSVGDIAGAIGIEPEDVLEAMQAAGAYRATSLDAPRAGGDDEPGATLGVTVGHVEDGFGRAEHRALLSRLMRSLTPREREVMGLRFEHDLTQAEIGQRIGVSQMQVSRILRHALARLRAPRAPRTNAAATDGTRSPTRRRTAAVDQRRGEARRTAATIAGLPGAHAGVVPD
jgi:RNA polymerase sigma-B factor